MSEGIDAPPYERYIDSKMVSQEVFSEITVLFFYAVRQLNKLKIYNYKSVSFQPIVSKGLIVQCREIEVQLIKKFGNRKKFKYEIVGEDEVTFKMLSSNLSQVISCLDEVRRRPK